MSVTQHEIIMRFKPLSTGGLLDRGFSVYREHVFEYLGISLMSSLPLYLLLIYFFYYLRTYPSEWGSLSYFISSLGMSLGLASFAFVAVWGRAAMIQATVHWMTGRPVSILSAFRESRARFTPVLILATIGMPLILAASLVYIIPGIFVAMGIAMSYPIILFEKPRVVFALSRCWGLLSSAGGRIFLVLGGVWLVFLLGFVNLLMARYLVVWVGEYFMPEYDLAYLNESKYLGQIFVIAIMILIKPLRDICTTLVYLDTRIRSEGLDLFAKIRYLTQGRVDLEEFVRG